MSSTTARFLPPALALFLAALPALAMPSDAAGADEPETGPPLAHTVFFTLKDRSPESRAAFVASCRKYLTGHDGVTSFAVGTIAEDVNEGAVSVRDFDVSLHAVFASKTHEAAYLVHPRHLQFVAENKPKFAAVRVFDTYLTRP